MRFEGIWLPIITPFSNGQIDFVSYRKLIDHYIAKGIHGIIPLGTTGECPAVSDAEFESIVEETLATVNGRIPVVVGLGGNYTEKVAKSLKTLEKYKVDGVLSVSPYYNRPDQRGIYEHFRHLSEATFLPIIIYNIPYRTGRNMENDTIRRLAELKNIVGLKDASGDFKQSMELLLDRPANFSILCGEDILYYPMMALGGDGGILASAHLKTEAFLQIYELVRSGDYQNALPIWSNLSRLIPLLFAEPSPGPIKYYLNQTGLITSAEARLPIMEITEELGRKLKLSF